MTNAEAAYFQSALEANRRELVRNIRAQTGQLSIDESEHDPIDQVQRMNQRDEAAAMLLRLSCTLSDVDRALEACANGSYGLCVECEEPMSLRRLEAIPWARHCISCQELLERQAPVRATSRASLIDADRQAA